MKSLTMIHRHMLKHFPMCLLAVAFCISCTDELTNSQSAADAEQIIQLAGNIRQETVTRVNDSGFVDGDEMGIFIVDYQNDQPGEIQLQGNRANNMCYVYDQANNRWNTTKNVYWKDDHTAIDVYGYYPFKDVVSSLTAYPFTVAYDQSLPATEHQLSNYEASDFLWAKATKVEPLHPVTLTYSHILAGVQVILKEGTGFAEGEWDKASKLVTVDHTLRKAEIDLVTGKARPVGSSDKHIIMAQENEGYRAVIIPQVIGAGKSLISLTLDGKSKSHKLSKDMNYQRGRLHQFTLRVDKKEATGDFELQLLNETILPWRNDELSHSFESNSYLIVHVEEPGTLKASLEKQGVNIYTLKNLKVTGKLTMADFDFMHNEMTQLKAINLHEVKVVNCVLPHEDATPEHPFVCDDVIPSLAFSNCVNLRHLVLPREIKHLAPFSLNGIQLTSELVLPESLTHIHDHALSGVTMTTNLPNKLEFIGGGAFADSNISMELKFPKTLKTISNYAFMRADHVYGTLSLPPHLEYLGEGAFKWVKSEFETAIIEIPPHITKLPDMVFEGLHTKNGVTLKLHDGVKEIGVKTFGNIRFNSPLYLPEGLVSILDGAFEHCHFVGKLVIPSSVGFIAQAAFCGTNISGELEIPKSIQVIRGHRMDGRLGNGSFANTQIEKLILPANLEQIEPCAFQQNASLREVWMGKYVSKIGEQAFHECNALQTFVCLNPEPPLLEKDCFPAELSPLAMLLVPEKSIDLYRNAPGWRNFTYITPYHELACNVKDIQLVNEGITVEGMVRSEGEWYVSHCPDWCEVIPNKGGNLPKTEIKVVVKDQALGSGNRADQIEFRLKEKDFAIHIKVNQQDINQKTDQEIMLQQASAGGEEIPIFFIGEGFGADALKDGSYLELMKQQMEYFFAIEPYKTYRNYFTVSTALAFSPESGVSTIMDMVDTKFHIIDHWGSLNGDVETIRNYAVKVSNHIGYHNVDRAVIAVICNAKRFGGNTTLTDEGTAISFCPISNDSYPYDQRGIIQHEVGGKGFGKLGEEGVSHYDFIQLCDCPLCNALDQFNHAKKKGWYDNLSLSSKYNEVPWNHLVFHPKYGQMVDMYEGGYNHQRGVYRSEPQSCMNTYIPYYNTISRESIVRRIMTLSGKSFSFDEFVKNDKIEKPNN